MTDLSLVKRSATGGCQCGAIRYRADRMFDNAHLCHCRMCQKAVGNIFAALVATPDEALHFTRGTPSTFASSAQAVRGFCAKCGTPLFYRGTSGRTNLTIGSLDNPGDFPPKTEIGIEARVCWFEGLPNVRDDGITEKTGQQDWAADIRASNRQHPDHDTENWLPPAI